MFKFTLAGLGIGGIILAFVVMLLVNAWIVMLVLGALASVFDTHKLAIGYSPSIIVTVALGVLGSFFKGNSK